MKRTGIFTLVLTAWMAAGGVLPAAARQHREAAHKVRTEEREAKAAPNQMEGQEVKGASMQMEKQNGRATRIRMEKQEGNVTRIWMEKQEAKVVPIRLREVQESAAERSAADTIPLTLEDALEIALSDNLTVRIADKEIIKQKYAKKGTYAALFPQINFIGDYQRNIKKQVMYMGDEAIKFGKDNSWSTGFSAALPIINVPLWKSIQITGMDVELAVEKARSSRVDLVDQVRQAFYSALLAMDSYTVYRENYENAVSNYEDVKQKYESGKTSKYDLIRAEVTMQNAMPAVYDAQNSIIVTQWQLKALIGMDLNLNIRCVGSLNDYTPVLNQVSILSNVPLDNNSELKQLEIQENILQKTYQMQLAKYYPSLNLSLNYQWAAMTDNFRFSTFRWNPYSLGGLSLTIPIFSGGQRYYDLKQTRVQQEQLRLQWQDAERNLNVSVKQYLSQMETSVKQYEAAAKSIEGADTGYKISQKRYEIGSGTLLELNDAQLALLQARLNLNQSIYSYLTAKSSLDKTLGINLSSQDAVPEGAK